MRTVLRIDVAERVRGYGLVEGFGVLRLRCARLRMTGFCRERGGRTTAKARWEKVYIPTHRKKRDGWGTPSLWAVEGENRQEQRQLQVLRLRNSQSARVTSFRMTGFLVRREEQTTANANAGVLPLRQAQGQNDKRFCGVGR
jgi:hypothetical protein